VDVDVDVEWVVKWCPGRLSCRVEARLSVRMQKVFQLKVSSRSKSFVVSPPSNSRSFGIAPKDLRPSSCCDN